MIISNVLMEEYNKTRDTKDASLICYAPFVSINFEQTGKATACCYNRTHVLGTYPQQSIREMWWGDKANELRAVIREKNLGGGCEVCSRQLESKNFFGTHARHFDPYADAPEKEENKSPFGFFKPAIHNAKKRAVNYPKAMEFELSNTCNLECVMCTGYFSSSIRKNREKLPPTPQMYDDAFVKQLEEFIPHLTDAKFLGGEPFLIDIYYSIWESILRINPNMLIHITTSATVLGGRAKNLLESLRCGIVISIDSIVKETYEHIRTNARYERVMENVEYFHKYTKEKKTWMSFAVCPMTINWNEIPDMVTHCNKEDIYMFFNTVFKPEEYSLRFLPARILGNIISHYKSVNFPPIRDVHGHNVNSFNDLIKQLERWHEDAVNHERLQMQTVQAIAGNLNTLTASATGSISPPVQTLLKHLLDFVKLKVALLQQPIAGKENDSVSEYQLAFIKDKENWIIELKRILKEQGFASFIRDYMQAVYELHLLLLNKKNDAEVKSRCAGVVDIIMEHPRYETIINELISLDPLYILSVVRNFKLYFIALQIKDSY
jgi:MoaA/NifB/PqqE/SkfB family radical SAM enzyme